MAANTTKKRPGAPTLALALACFLSTLLLATAMASAAAPTVTLNGVSQVEYTTAVLNGAVHPNGPKVAAYRLEYAAQPDFSDAKDLATGTVEGGAVQSVTGELTGLSAQTSYTFYVRLVAESSEGTAEATETVSFETKEAEAPHVDHAYVTGVTQTAAVLGAAINPRGATTTYSFQYLTQVAFEENEAEGREGFFGAAETPTATLEGKANPDDVAAAPLSGLSPATAYRYRLLAENAKGSVEATDAANGEEAALLFRTYAEEPTGPQGCPNEALREEQHSTYLPDCRAYEMVSPAGKEGGEPRAVSSVTGLAEDGSAALFDSLLPFGNPEGSSYQTEYLAERTAAPRTQGWSTHPVTPKQGPDSFDRVFPGSHFEPPFAPDLSRGIYYAWPSLTDAPNVSVVGNLYAIGSLRGPALDSPGLLSGEAYAPLPKPPPDGSYTPVSAGASADLSHVIFESHAPLLGAEPENRVKLYESFAGRLSLVGMVPPPGQTECEEGGAVPCQPAAGSTASPSLFSWHYPILHAISADGSRVAFTGNVVVGSEGVAVGGIYLRTDGTRTVQLNVPENGSSEPPQGARLAVASSGVDAEGNIVPMRVFFTTGQQLLAADTNATTDLYMWSQQPDAAGHHLTLITTSQELRNPEGALTEFFGASDDGSYVYFENNAPDGEHAVYVWHEGSISYLGAVPNMTYDGSNGPARADYGFLSALLRSRVSPDGRHLLFMSQSSNGLQGVGGLSGFDHGKCPGVGGGVFGCDELYLYSAESGRLRCATCNPSGAAATAKAIDYAAVGSGAKTWKLPRALSADGRYVFFTTGESLVPRDTNGVSDAYEYDSATEEVHLLSSGNSPKSSYFVEASPDGRDVLIATKQRLLGWDGDGEYDLYDARIRGGFPEPPAVAAPCEAESCRPAAPSPPPPAPLGSHLSGPGNPHPRRPHPCRRHGRRCHHRHRHAHHRPHHLAARMTRRSSR